MTPDGKLLLAGTGGGLSSGAVYMFDSSGHIIWKYSTDRIISTLAISQDGNYIVAGGFQLGSGPLSRYENGEIYLLNNKGDLLWSITTGQSPVFGVIESANGSRIAVNYASGILYVNNFGNVLWNYTTRSFPSVEMMPDGSLIVSAWSSSVSLLDNKGNLLWNYTFADGEFAGPVGISANGQYISAGADNSSEYGDVYLLNRQGSLLWKNHVSSAILSSSVSSNGSYVSAGTNWGVLFYNKGGNLLRNDSLDYGESETVFSPDGSYILVNMWGDVGHTIMLFDDKGNEKWGYSAGEVHAASISANGSYVASAAGPAGSEGVPGTLFFFSSSGNGNALAGVAGFLWTFISSSFFILFEYGTAIVLVALSIILATILVPRMLERSGEQRKAT